MYCSKSSCSLDMWSKTNEKDWYRTARYGNNGYSVLIFRILCKNWYKLLYTKFRAEGIFWKFFQAFLKGPIRVDSFEQARMHQMLNQNCIVLVPQKVESLMIVNFYVRLNTMQYTKDYTRETIQTQQSCTRIFSRKSHYCMPFQSR